MAKKTKVKKPEELKFYKRLVLSQYMLGLFGARELKDLVQGMKDPKLEAIDPEGVSGFSKHLLEEFGECMTFDKVKVQEYDLNIVRHTRAINEQRHQKVVLKYFQYLSLLFVEYYLDMYFNDRDVLLTDLNDYVQRFNDGNNPADQVDPYKASDLNKLALWNATGSGKTLLMHINYLQYLHYSKTIESDEKNILLLTPNEGLTDQHLLEFKASGINAIRFSKAGRGAMRHANEVSIIENTKFDIKDGDKRVAVESFGDDNLVFVDEGHRGSSGLAWKQYRDMLCKKGFSFEYSATFGQAIKAAGKKDLTQEYARCIIFDYSYKYFHADGFGKHYNILNLADDGENHIKRLYLTASLLTFYQQKKLYQENGREFARFNIEDPLCVFVGSSVTAVRTEKGEKVSDVVDILQFLEQFMCSPTTGVADIERLLSGNTGLLDNRERDIFRDSFAFLLGLGKNPKDLYADLRKVLFNCSSSEAVMHVENLKGVQGEIRLRMGENAPFGVINVGDDGDLLKLCGEAGLETGSVDFSHSLFHTINASNSSVNFLIGSKKFTEGWNCWRVSMMGLMNVGRSEGSEIIQLFGRGVRLKGYEMSLKRSSHLSKERLDLSFPKHISLLETLNVFGIRADYMRQFKEYLDEEGVDTEGTHPMRRTMPVIRNYDSTKVNRLYTLKMREDLDYKKHAPKPTLSTSGTLGVVVLDCYAKLQFESSRLRYDHEVTKNVDTLKAKHRALFNYDEIYFELQRYKNEKARHNLNLSKNAIITLLERSDWYKLLIPAEELELRSFDDYKRWQRIAITLLQLYCDKFYDAEKRKWETPHQQYVALSYEDDPNLEVVREGAYDISLDKVTEASQLVVWLDTVIDKAKEARKKRQLFSILETQGDMTVSHSPMHLYSPLFHVAKKNTDITMSPVALNEGEYKFVTDLKEFLEGDRAKLAKHEFYLLRNLSRRGISFFETHSGFFPDFILWVLQGNKQYITFVDPKGMRSMSIDNDKVKLAQSIKDIEARLRVSNANIVLNSVLLSNTKHAEMEHRSVPRSEWKANNVFFMEEEGYIGEMIEAILN